MAERKNFSRYNIRCGLILRAKVAGVKLLGFQIPPLDSRYQVLTGRDLQEGNTLSFFDGTMPLLAVDKISYVGQPILALFGPDYESVEIILSRIVVNTTPLDIKETHDAKIEPLEFAWGMDDLPETRVLENLRKVETSFRFVHKEYISALRYTVLAWQDGKDLHIQLPSQWNDLVKTTICKNCNWLRKNVIIHNVKYSAPYDEYLYMPALQAALAAMVVIKTGNPVEIRSVGESAKPGILVHRNTYCNIEGKVLFDDVEMTIDQGAYLFASEECQRQAITGLLPYYPAKSFRAKVYITSSDKHPASFCGSLGYSEALAATAYHTSRLADNSSSTPAQLRDAVEKEKTRFTDYVPAYDIENHRKHTMTIAEDAVFNRKWAANTFQRGDFGLIGYLTGIGIATGSGIAGFSTTMAKKNGFISLITYTQKRSVTVNTSAVFANVNIKYWKNIIESKMGKDQDISGIIFLDQNPDAMDSGPDVLSRFTCCFSPQLASAAKLLNNAKNSEKLPVSIKFEAENIYSPCEFEYSGYGTVITEIKISRKDFKPVVKEVWASFSLTKIIDGEDIREKAKRAILSTLKECGASIPGTFTMHVSFTAQEDGGDTISSITAIAKGLTMASFASALQQACGDGGAELPTSARKLQESIRGGKA